MTNGPVHQTRKANGGMFTLLVPCLLALSACATMDADDCAVADWTALGQVDGDAGETTARFEKRAKACSKHGFAADFAQWQAGQAQGLVTYCLPQRGFREGVEGRSYHGVCPPETQYSFMQGYSDGRRYYDVYRELESARSNWNSSESNIRDYERQLHDFHNKLADPRVSDSDKQMIRGRINRLREQRAYEYGRQDSLRREIDRWESAVWRVRAELSAKWGAF